MDELVIKKDTPRISSINRTIRISTECFEQLTAVSENTDVSFNKVVSQCLVFALEHINPDLLKSKEE